MINKNQSYQIVTLTNIILVLLIGLVSFSGCASKNLVQKSSEPIPMGDILVMPFENMHQTCGIDLSFRCPLVGAFYEISEVDEGAKEFLTDSLFSRLHSRGDLNLIDPYQAMGARSAVLSKNSGELSEKDLILETARSTGADTVLVGRVFSYRDRVGTAYSIQSPASVAFDVLLIRVSDGQLLWVGRYNETQKSLFENLFGLGKFISRGGRWLSADELADSGMAKVLKGFPDPA